MLKAFFLQKNVELNPYCRKLCMKFNSECNLKTFNCSSMKSKNGISNKKQNQIAIKAIIETMVLNSIEKNCYMNEKSAYNLNNLPKEMKN